MNSSRLLRCGAVFHWTPTTWADAYRDFTITGTPEIRGGVAYFDGVGDKAASKIQPKGIKTVLLKLRAGSTTEQFVDFDGGSHYIDVSAGTIRAQGFTSPTIYKGGSVGSSLAADETAWIAVTTATGFDASALAFAFDGSNYGDVDIFDAIMFPRVLSATEITNISKGDPFPYDRHIVSLWKPAANGALIDVIGGNDGTPVNIDASNVVDGPWGRKALSLNGSDENEITGNASSLVFDNSSQFSFGCAVKWKGAPSGNYPQIIDVGDLTGTNRNYLLGTWLNTRELFVEFMDISGFPNWRYFRTGILLDDNGWNIVLVSWSASGLGSTKYLNVYVFKLSGLSTYSTSTTYNWISGNGYASIGKSISNSTFFKGDVLSPFVARSAITQLEAADIYNRIMDGAL